MNFYFKQLNISVNSTEIFNKKFLLEEININDCNSLRKDVVNDSKYEKVIDRAPWQV